MPGGTRASQSFTAPTSSSVRPRAVAVGAATVAALVVWSIGKAAGAELEVIQRAGDPATEVGFAVVAAASFFASLLGWGVLALLEKFAPARSLLIWTVLATAVAVLSILPALFAEASDGTKATLPLVHLTVGAVVILLMRRGAARSR